MREWRIWMDIQKTLHAQNKLCTGCSACHDSCPVHAIHMEEDSLGFFYPVVDEERCTDCRRCGRVCPKLNAYHGNSEMPDCYAARAEDKIRMESSSGGIFTVLARYVLSQGGIVCGAAMDETYTVRHICVENEEGLARLRQSKYVQSDMRHVYREIKEHRDKRRTVLFSGCPCQVVGIRNYFGNDDGILYVDVLCHGVPSNKMLQDYIRESFRMDKISGLSFRSKLNGWRADQLRVFFRDGTSECIPWEESAYEEGFQRNIILRDGCEDCEFCGKQRQGDITLGDFWRVEEYDPALNDGKGTSVVLVNNRRGEDLLHQVARKLYDIRKTPTEAARYNKFQEKFAPHPLKERFKILYTGGHNFAEAVLQCRHSLYDIGLIGHYTTGNYGGELTQYALYRTLTDLGYSVLMIAQPENSSEPPCPRGAHLFESEPYASWDKSRYFANTAEMKFLNLQCRVFVTGSDQMFNNNLYRELEHYMVQDFVKDNHCKIAYAASFGHDRIWGSESDRASESYFLKKFDYISTREDSGVEVFRREFGVEAVQVLDPVFLCPDRWYEAFIARCARDVPKKPYLFAYILDPDRDKEAILRNYADKNNLAIKALTDHYRYFSEPEQIKNAWNIDTCTYLSMESWLAHIAKSEFVITDSFHGMCVAIINHRQFIVIVNKLRGETRFVSILKLLGLEHRMVYSASELEEKLNDLGSIDYRQVDNILTAERHKSIQWLCNAIEAGKKQKKPFSTFDLTDARIDELWKRTDQRMDQLTRMIPQEETIRKLEDEIRKLNERIDILEQLTADDDEKAAE